MEPILQKGILTNFFAGFDEATPQWEKVATKVPSTAASEDYSWISSLPGMRKMDGERVPRKLKAYKYTLPNEEFEDSIEVKRADIKDDQTGKYGLIARGIGEAARLFPDEKLFGELLPNGFTELAYDGQYFFDTDHEFGSNKLTTDLDATEFDKARAMLGKMKDENGRPVNNNMKLVLVVPEDLRGTGETILETKILANGAENKNYQKAELLVSAWISDADSWFLLNVSGVIKPLIVQEREWIPFESLEEGSEEAWWRKKFYYGTYWRGNFGYGLPQKAVGSTGA
jgi:phage major head subunit gpT-like protein